MKMINPNKLFNRQNKRKGMVLIFVLIAIVALTLALSAIHLHTLQETRSLSQTEFAVVLSNMAEGALKKALEKLQYDLSGSNPFITGAYAYSNILNYYKPTVYDTDPATNPNPKIPYIFSGSKDTPQTLTFPGGVADRKYIVYIYDNDKYRDGTMNQDEGPSPWNLLTDKDRKIRVDILVYFRTFRREFEAMVEVNKPFDDYALILKGDTLFNENSNAATTHTTGTNPGIRTTGHIYIDDSAHVFSGSINSSNGVCCPGGCGSYTINGGKGQMDFPAIVIADYLNNYFLTKCNPNVGSEECYQLDATGAGGTGRVYRWIGSWDLVGSTSGNPCSASTDYIGWCFDTGNNRWEYNKAWVAGVETPGIFYVEDFRAVVYNTGTTTTPQRMTILANPSIIINNQGGNPIYISPYNFNQSQYKDANNFVLISGKDISIYAHNTTTNLPNFGGNSRGGIIMAAEQLKIDRPNATEDIGPWIKGLVYVENSADVSSIVSRASFTNDGLCGSVNFTNGSFIVAVDARPRFTYFGGLNPFPFQAMQDSYYKGAVAPFDAPWPRVVDFTPLF